MGRIRFGVMALLAVMAVCVVGGVQALDSQAPDSIEMGLGSEPKGVILRGPASGMPQVESVDYDAARNVFVLNNGSAYYQNPVDKGAFLEILQALSQHDHLGVSIRFDRTFFTYGGIPMNSRTAKDLAAADKILGGVVFALRDFVGRTKLPGNYTPKAVSESQRRVLSVATFFFGNYSFAPDGQGVYRRTGFNMEIKMIPVHRDRRAPDGGYVRDTAAEARGGC